VINRKIIHNYHSILMKIGERMKTFLLHRFGTITNAAKAYENKASNYFQPYFKNTSVPGGELLNRFAEWGCNLNWLMSGEGAMLIQDEKARIEQEYTKQARLLTMQSIQPNAAPVRTGISPAMDNPPDEVIIVKDIRILNEFTVMVVALDGKRTLYVKINE